MLTFEQFESMIDELLIQNPPSYDTLVCIAMDELRPAVLAWCANDPVLNGRSYEEDILQEICVRLMKTVVTHFLLKDGINSINRDPFQFRKWMFRVAINIKKDFADKIRRQDHRYLELSEEYPAQEIQESDKTEDNKATLKKAFDVIIDSADTVSIYKVLTWLAQFVFVTVFDFTVTEANKQVVKVFEEKTLYEMYFMIQEFSNELKWLEFSNSQDQRIRYALQKTWDNDRVIGEVCFKEFYMKKGGNATVSDWINRMNHIIRRNYKGEPFND